MLVFGVDIPLIEVVFALALISFVILVEIIVVVILLMQNLNRSKDLSDTLVKLAQILLDVKKEELKEIEKLKR